MRRRTSLLLAALLVPLGLYALRPADRGGPHLPAHAPLAALLRAETPGRNVAVLDLDQVRANAAVIRANVHPDVAIRVVSKSLPSLPLLEAVLGMVGSDRLMVFSEPYLDAVLGRFGTGVDVLLGKPLPAEAAARLGARHDLSRVAWLVDDAARLEAYRQLAGPPLRVAIELDVGLRRGGVSSPTALVELLTTIAAHPDRLRFAGFMGYDGHVPHALPLISSADGEFTAVMKRYSTLRSVGQAAAPGLFGPDTLYDSGGSHTW